MKSILHLYNLCKIKTDVYSNFYAVAQNTNRLLVIKKVQCHFVLLARISSCTKSKAVPLFDFPRKLNPLSPVGVSAVMVAVALCTGLASPPAIIPAWGEKNIA